jgi:hypothetical protein
MPKESFRFQRKIASSKVKNYRNNKRAYLHKAWEECACAMNELGELVDFSASIGILYELSHPSRRFCSLR